MRPEFKEEFETLRLQPTATHVRRLLPVRASHVGLALALAVFGFLPAFFIVYPYREQYARVSGRHGLSGSARAAIYLGVNNLAGLLAFLYFLHGAPRLLWGKRIPHSVLLPVTVAWILVSFAYALVRLLEPDSTQLVFAIYITPLLLMYLQYRRIFAHLGPEVNSRSPSRSALNITLATFFPALVVFLYTFIFPSVFLSASSEVERAVLRLIAHPLAMELMLIGWRLTSRFLRDSYDADPYRCAYLGSVLFSVSALYGRFYVSSMQTFEGQILVSIATALEDAVLRVSIATRDSLIYRVFSSKETAVRQKRIDLDTGFDDFLVHLDETFEIASIMSSFAAVGIFPLSADGVTPLDWTEHVVVFVVALVSEVMFDLVSSSVALLVGRGAFNVRYNGAAPGSGVTQMEVGSDPPQQSFFQMLLATSYKRNIRFAWMWTNKSDHRLVSALALMSYFSSSCLLAVTLLSGLLCKSETGLLYLCNS